MRLYKWNPGCVVFIAKNMEDAVEKAPSALKEMAEDFKANMIGNIRNHIEQVKSEKDLIGTGWVPDAVPYHGDEVHDTCRHFFEGPEVIIINGKKFKLTPLFNVESS